jgi:hypothetical protein
MRRSLLSFTLAAALLAGCASQPAAQSPLAQAAASGPASAQTPTSIPSAEAQVTTHGTPSPVAAPTEATGATPAPAPTATPLATARTTPTATPPPTARPTPAPTPKPTPVAVPTEAPVATAVPVATPTPVPPMAFPAGFVSASEAIGYVGQVATVCGTVVSANYAVTSNGSPTFLNLDKPYQTRVFAIVIWPEHRASFGGAPESAFFGARVCIRGRVSDYKGIAQVESAGGDIEVYE